MHITLLTNNDIASVVALNYLYRGLANQHSLRVLISAQVGKHQPTPHKPEALLHLKFVEQTLFSDLVFPALHHGLMSPAQTAQQKLAANKLLSFNEFQHLGVEVLPITSINDPLGVQKLAKGKPDLCVSIRFGLILKSAVLALPRFGVINLHSGKLPEYRGVMATLRAMLAKDAELSTTLHFINDGTIDTGPVIATHSIKCDDQGSYLENVLALYPGGVDTILQAIHQLDRYGNLSSQPHTNTGQYFSFPDQADLLRFHAMGGRLYDPQHLVKLIQQFML
jgi:methionyl-tRNA formyltransferase